MPTNIESSGSFVIVMNNGTNQSPELVESVVQEAFVKNNKNIQSDPKDKKIIRRIYTYLKSKLNSVHYCSANLSTLHELAKKNTAPKYKDVEVSVQRIITCMREDDQIPIDLLRTMECELSSMLVILKTGELEENQKIQGNSFVSLSIGEESSKETNNSASNYRIPLVVDDDHSIEIPTHENRASSMDRENIVVKEVLFNILDQLENNHVQEILTTVMDSIICNIQSQNCQEESRKRNIGYEENEIRKSKKTKLGNSSRHVLNKQESLLAKVPMIKETPPIESHDVVQAISKGYCGVCGGTASIKGDLIVFCDQCGIPVHQSCYGISVVPKGEWKCRVCSSGVAREKAVCFLCNQYGGAMKATVDGRWAHLICVWWSPHASTKSMKKEDLVYLPIRLTNFEENYMCSLCERRGFTIRCYRDGCSKSFHPICGRSRGGYLEVGYDSHFISFQAYCDRHKQNRFRFSDLMERIAKGKFADNIGKWKGKMIQIKKRFDQANSYDSIDGVLLEIVSVYKKALEDATLSKKRIFECISYLMEQLPLLRRMYASCTVYVHELWRDRKQYYTEILNYERQRRLKCCSVCSKTLGRTERVFYCKGNGSGRFSGIHAQHWKCITHRVLKKSSGSSSNYVATMASKQEVLNNPLLTVWKCGKCNSDMDIRSFVLAPPLQKQISIEDGKLGRLDCKSTEALYNKNSSRYAPLPTIHTIEIDHAKTWLNVFPPCIDISQEELLPQLEAMAEVASGDRYVVSRINKAISYMKKEIGPWKSMLLLLKRDYLTLIDKKEEDDRQRAETTRRRIEQEEIERKNKEEQERRDKEAETLLIRQQEEVMKKAAAKRQSEARQQNLNQKNKILKKYKHRPIKGLMRSKDRSGKIPKASRSKTKDQRKAKNLKSENSSVVKDETSLIEAKHTPTAAYNSPLAYSSSYSSSDSPVVQNLKSIESPSAMSLTQPRNREIPVKQSIRKQVHSVLGKVRYQRCHQCPGCHASDCRLCIYCLDMKKYGGPGTRKRSCQKRVCQNPRAVPSGGVVKKTKRELW